YDSSSLVSLARLPPPSRSARCSSSPDDEESVPLYDSGCYQSLDHARWLIIFWLEPMVWHAGDSLHCLRGSRRNVERLPGAPGLSERVFLDLDTGMLEFSLRLATLNLP